MKDWIIPLIPAVIILCIACRIWLQVWKQRRQKEELEQLTKDIEGRFKPTVSDPPKDWYKPYRKK